MDKQNRSIEERMKEWKKLLDRYESQLGLPPYTEQSLSPELKKYLDMSPSQIERLSSDERRGIAYYLVSFAFHLQRAQNRERAEMGRAKAVIRHIICGEVRQYQGSFANMDACAINNNESATVLNKIIAYTQERVDRLDKMALQLNTLAKILN